MKTTIPVASEKQVFISFARGLSMLTIVLYHFLQYVQLPPLLAKANLIGGAGIYIFLFASSYGLYFSKTSSWKVFYIKRFKKVLLPYYIGITLIFIVNQFIPLYPEGWQAYASHLFLYKMFFERYENSFGPHFWFVSTIIQFYLLWPLFSFASKILKSNILIILSLAISIAYSLVIYKIGVNHDRIWYSSVIQYFWILFLGLATAKEQWLPRLLQLGLVRYILLFIIGLSVTLGISYFFGEQGNIFNDYFMFIAYFSGCFIVFAIGQRLTFIVRFLLWIESFSYSLYIIHLFIFILYLKAFSKTHISLYEVPVITGICIVLALVFDKLVSRLTSPKSGHVRLAAKV